MSPEVQKILEILFYPGCIALGIFIRDWLSTRSKLVKADADATIKNVSLSLKEREALLTELSHHRDLIDTLGSKQAASEALAQEKSNQVEKLQAQQLENISRLATLQTERDGFKRQINDLQTKAELRHKEMNEQAARESALNSTIQDLQQDLKKANDRILELETEVRLLKPLESKLETALEVKP